MTPWKIMAVWSGLPPIPAGGFKPLGPSSPSRPEGETDCERCQGTGIVRVSESVPCICPGCEGIGDIRFP